MTKLGVSIIVMAAACGGGSGGGLGTGPITQAQAEELCTLDCQHDIDCGSGTDLTSCVANCTQDLVGWARADAVETVFECGAALACEASDDACFDAVVPLSIHDEWETACRSELAACLDPADVEGICEASAGSGDVGFIRLIAPTIVQEMLDCLPAPACDARLTCLQGVFDAHGIEL